MPARTKPIATTIVALVVIFIVCIGFSNLFRNQGERRFTHSEIAGPAVLKGSADKLKLTVVTAHLEQEIEAGKNVLWCATAQIAWNELCDLIGGPVHLKNEPKMVPVLNKRIVTREDLDPASYIAMAGFTEEGILEKIQKAIEEKFEGQGSPELLPAPGSLGPGLWVAYSYLFKDLSFEWAFERLKRPLTFQKHKVECFGIEQYLAIQKNEVKAATQLFIYDYRCPDDFIIELKTRSKTDRLILAKIVPSVTLAETIARVQKRVDSNKPTKITECNTLMIPVLDFEIMREYSELYGKAIRSKNPRFDGTGFAIARQHIRFKLDETGAVLKSEAIFAGSIGQNMIFDKPFLIMIQRTDSNKPYFALWIDNAELLVSKESPVRQ